MAVVESESVTEAARHLHVSPGGVSAAITDLEEKLGVQLTLRRRGQGVAITPNGRWMYEQCRVLYEQLENISQVAQIMRGELSGPLRIGCYLTLSPWFLPRIAAHFSENYPGVDLHFIEDGSDELQARLQAGDIDAALIYDNHLRHGFDGRAVTALQLQLAFSPEHPLAAQQEIELKQLLNENAILLDMQPSIARIESIFQQVGAKLKILWRSRNIETIRSMVARNLGYSILMGRPYGDHTYEGLPIVYRKIANPIPQNTVVIATPSGTIFTSKLDALVEYCHSEFANQT